ncbi:MAG TPA: hypothetical protein VFW16_07800 [Streptosporangiaceae bacterium]|nr:hypothetical protein [Streptosporangiaceae bacterium]
MGIAIGIVLVGATIASFVMINARASRMARQYRDDGRWSIDPQTGQPVPPQHGQGRGGHHGVPNHGAPNHGAPNHGASGHHGGGGGGHFGGGHDGGGFSGGGGHHG